MSKFKPGDKVIFVADGSKLKLRTERGMLKKCFTLKNQNGSYWYVKETGVAFKEDWLEHEHIYDSPLYKVMK
jgi:phage gp45-like